MSPADRAMSLADSAWLHLERPDNLMMVTGLLLLDRNPDRARLEVILRERFLCFERFGMVVVEPTLGVGVPHWRPADDFVFEQHVRYESMPDATEEDLLLRAGHLMSQPLPRERPLWDLLVLEDLRQGAAVLVRLHHAIADGVALMKVLLNLAEHEDGEEGASAFPLERGKEKRQDSVWKTARRLAHGWLQQGHDLLFCPEQARQAVAGGWRASKSLTRVLAMPADSENPLRGELSVEKRVAVSPPLPVDSIKTAGKRMGATVNDMLMAVLAGAVGRYLRRLQEVPESLEVRAVVPIDLRQGDLEELGNRFGLVFLPLPVGERDHACRLARVHQAMQELKDSPEALVTYDLLSAVGVLPAPLEQSIVEWFGNKATAVVTSLHGPDEMLTLGAARLTGLMYWVPQSGRLGLGVSMISYAGQFRVGVASDAGLLGQPEQLVDDFLFCLDEVLRLSCA